jgi:parvulin-like peptidyl-prolyl isomerase
LKFRLILLRGQITLAKKQNPIEHGKHVTRRQASRHEREQKTNRIIVITVGVIILIALVLGGYGVYASTLQPMQTTVLDINGTKISMDYYLTMLKLSMQQNSAEQLKQLTESTQAAQFSASVLGQIEKNIVLIQEAPKLGYSVDSKEITDTLTEAKLPDQQVYRDIFTGMTLQQKLLSDYFARQYPASVEQARVQALVVESAQIAENITQQFKKGETFTILAKTYGIEKVTKEKGGELGWLPKGMIAQVLGISDAGILEKNVFSLNAGEISKPIYDPDIVKGTGYWVVKVEEKTDIACHMRVILVGTAEEAADVVKKLAAGADFATLAKQVSQDASKDDGGDKGWINKYTPDPNLTLLIDTAFNTPANTVAAPIHDMAIETKGGYWVIRAAEKEANRAVDKDTRDRLVGNAFNKWLDEQQPKVKIQELITKEQQTWAINRVLKELKVKS